MSCYYIIKKRKASLSLLLRSGGKAALRGTFQRRLRLRSRSLPLAAEHLRNRLPLPPSLRSRSARRDQSAAICDSFSVPLGGGLPRLCSARSVVACSSAFSPFSVRGSPLSFPNPSALPLPPRFPRLLGGSLVSHSLRSGARRRVAPCRVVFHAVGKD